MMNKLKRTIDKMLDDAYERLLGTTTDEGENIAKTEIVDLYVILDLIRDARRSVYAVWERGHLGGEDAYVCSKCGVGFTGPDRAEIAYSHKYCPECGSKMDLSEIEFDGDTWSAD